MTRPASPAARSPQVRPESGPARGLHSRRGFAGLVAKKHAGKAAPPREALPDTAKSSLRGRGGADPRTDAKGTEPSEARERRRRGRDEMDREPTYLEPSGHLALSVLLVPPGVRPASDVPSPGLAHAEFAAAAQRWLESVHVGRDGKEVRLRLRGEIEVRLENVGGVLRTTLHGEGDLSRMALRLERELSRRGLAFERVEFG